MDETTGEPIAEFPPGESWTLRGIRTEVEIDGGVVVGDDGSASARRALVYAYDEAARRGAPLHVVRAWSRVRAAKPDDIPFGVTPSLDEMQQATQDETRRRIDEIAQGRDCVETHVHTALGPAARILLNASRSADVLVVATRGLTGLTSVLVGSVATECIRHARCPVVVVR